MAIDVSHHCEQVMEMAESLNSTSKDLMKMNNTIPNLLTVGLPNPSYSNEKFIGKEDYMKKLHNTMNLDLGN